MRYGVLALVTALVYVLHQDFWFWRSARPLVFGFLPIGLAYHAAYTVGVSVLMLYLVRGHWPGHLESDPRDPRVPRPPVPRVPLPPDPRVPRVPRPPDPRDPRLPQPPDARDPRLPRPHDPRVPRP